MDMFQCMPPRQNPGSGPDIFILLTPLLRFSTSILHIMMGLPQNDQLFRKYSTLFSVFGIQVQNTPDLVDFITCGTTKNRSHHITPRESVGSVKRLKVGVSVLPLLKLTS